jgi:haloalkane dehalogenase
MGRCSCPARRPHLVVPYRHIVRGLADRFRCVALDYPGFGLSTAPAGYRYTIAEHARVVDGFVEQLALRR